MVCTYVRLIDIFYRLFSFIDQIGTYVYRYVVIRPVIICNCYCWHRGTLIPTYLLGAVPDLPILYLCCYSSIIIICHQVLYNLTPPLNFILFSERSSPSLDGFPMLNECTLVQRFREDVGSLIMGVDTVNGYATIIDVLAEVVIFY